MSDFAPIALFVFKRLEHTQRALEALALNFEFKDSPLFIFCDGARHVGEVMAVEAVRELVRAFPHPTKTVVESPGNLGLANSIVHGVTRLCNEFGRVIVVEDDLIVSPVFLDYMNTALERYADEPKVMQISGYMFPVGLQADTDAVFLPFTTSWGWATWKRAWMHYQGNLRQGSHSALSIRRRIAFDLGGTYPYYKMLKLALEGKRDSWAIKWYLSVFLSNGLVLYPTLSLVNNVGFDGSGTHCGSQNQKAAVTLLQKRITKFPLIDISQKAFSYVKAHIRAERGFMRYMVDWLLRFI